jgi:hypothetical protein
MDDNSAKRFWKKKKTKPKTLENEEFNNTNKKA